jgi:hypothetical protein
VLARYAGGASGAVDAADANEEPAMKATKISSAGNQIVWQAV